MKKVIIIIVMVGIAGIIAAYFLGAFRPAAEPAFQNTPAPSTKPSPSATIKPGSSPSASNQPLTTPAASVNVEFSLLITGVTGSGLSRTVAADITNSGTATAHNVSAKVEVFSGGSRVQINGQDFLTVAVGTLGPGGKLTKQVEVSFGLFDGTKVLQNGADIVMTVSSDEKTETFTYSYKP